MKLKEKLCKEWVEEIYFGRGADQRDAFIAGFEKAKELLRQKELSKVRDWFEVPMRELIDLGEEEVNEESK